MRYQWGRKDPFTFATSSYQWGVGSNENGKYPVKIYTIDGVLIYQADNGANNKDKQPAGGVIFSSTLASSMMEVIKSPIMFYTNPIISQSGQTRELWDYYWTSYSRGTDGDFKSNSKHNNYLDGYVSKRYKSIYDPCPYGFRVPPNGTYNQFNSNQGWTLRSYTGGVTYEKTWFTSTETRESTCYYVSSGRAAWRNVSIPTDKTYVSTIIILNNNRIYYSGGDSHERYRPHPVRCIEDHRAFSKKSVPTRGTLN